MPNYPVYPTQITGGNLPSMQRMGPPDLRPSSSTAPFYQGKFNKMYGRHLAGVGFGDVPAVVADEDVEHGWAVNEVQNMEAMDDVQASGVFDPPGSRPNVNPDYGILAVRYSLPGFVARERMFAPSEVRDVTNGEQAVHVPAGWTVADDASKIAFVQNRFHQPPAPVLAWTKEAPLRGRPTQDATIPAQPVSGLGALPSTTVLIGALAIAGLAAGAWMVTKGKR